MGRADLVAILSLPISLWCVRHCGLLLLWQIAGLEGVARDVEGMERREPSVRGAEQREISKRSADADFPLFCSTAFNKLH
jgi:hypothetical protein